MKYYYGLDDQEIYSAEDIDSAYEEIDCSNDPCIGCVIVEMVISKRSGIRWCNYYECFEPECGRVECGEKYIPVNGKNGICKNIRWALHPTGATWEIVGEWKYKKLSGRK